MIDEDRLQLYCWRLDGILSCYATGMRQLVEAILPKEVDTCPLCGHHLAPMPDEDNCDLEDRFQYDLYQHEKTCPCRKAWRAMNNTPEGDLVIGFVGRNSEAYWKKRQEEERTQND